MISVGCYELSGICSERLTVNDREDLRCRSLTPEERRRIMGAGLGCSVVRQERTVVWNESISMLNAMP